jgi:hypothetical protein
MERDILEGREHMNLSQWDTYSADQQQTLAAKIVQETKLHNMPLLQYRMIHWDARITNADVRVFSEWAHGSKSDAGKMARRPRRLPPRQQYGLPRLQTSGTQGSRRILQAKCWRMNRQQKA